MEAKVYEVKGKGKGKVVAALLFFNWAPRHHEGVLGEWRYSSTSSLTSTLDGSEWSASCPGLFNPREKALGIHWIGGMGRPHSPSGRSEEKNSQR